MFRHVFAIFEKGRERKQGNRNTMIVPTKTWWRFHHSKFFPLIFWTPPLYKWIMWNGIMIKIMMHKTTTIQIIACDQVTEMQLSHQFLPLNLQSWNQKCLRCKTGHITTQFDFTSGSICQLKWKGYYFGWVYYIFWCLMAFTILHIHLQIISTLKIIAIFGQLLE